jgi:orotidine-5'-phosphate decarboxylase
MDKAKLIEAIKEKKSFLCIGLDSDINKIPQHLLNEEDPVFAFNKAIIDATHDLVIAYKPNLAFYESNGLKGWESLEKTISYLKKFNKIFTIADAKRGDIGNTSKQYAQTFLGKMNFDAITVAPYMGEDSVAPFLSFDDKWVILLALTSNKGSNDFQMLNIEGSDDLIYERVIKNSLKWGSDKNMMYVVGATKTEMLSSIRKIIPNHFLLVPGVGAQGGSLEEVAKYGLNKDYGLIVNSSRGIIFADSTEKFAEIAREKAMELQEEMARMLNSKKT